MSKNHENSSRQKTIDSFFKILNDSNKGFNYEQNQVHPPSKYINKIPSNKTQIPISQKKITTKIKSPLKFNNREKSIFDGLLGRKKLSMENTENIINKENKENSKLKKEKKEIKKKKIKNNNKGFNDDYMNEYLEIDAEEMRKKLEEEEMRKKLEEEEKQMNYNKILQRNLMGNKERKFMTQNEENEERRQKEEEIKKSLFNMSMSIPYINPIKQNNIDKYKSFHPLINDIFKNVLDFNFYNIDLPTEEIPNTFDNEAHYRYVWITDFFNELKYCLLNEKIEKSEVQNYEDADIKIDIVKSNDIDDTLSLFKMNANKKLYELKRKILKDNDIIAIYNENSTFDKEQITLKNENLLNYFLGIVTRDFDSNDLNLLVLRKYYINYIKFEETNKDKNNISMFNKKIKYLGTINSSLREYNIL